MKNNKNISRKDRLKSKRLAPANYLIVCEGKQTEPNYFNGLKKKINKNYGSKVDVLIPNIEIKGTGENTTALVKYTDKFVNYSNKRYGQVWVVFDKDDYSDEQFDKAIKTCDYNVAWSNPNFELWLLMHFPDIDKYDREMLLENRKNLRQEIVPGASTKKKYLEIQVASQCPGYKKGNSIKFERFKDGVELAVKQAKLFCEEPGMLRRELGTAVGKLIQDMKK